MTRMGEGPAVCSPDLMSTAEPPEHPLLGGAEDRLDAPAGPPPTPDGDVPGRDPDDPTPDEGDLEASAGAATAWQPSEPDRILRRAPAPRPPGSAVSRTRIPRRAPAPRPPGHAASRGPSGPAPKAP